MLSKAPWWTVPSWMGATWLPSPIFVHAYSYLLSQHVFYWGLAPGQMLCLMVGVPPNTPVSRKDIVHAPTNLASSAVTLRLAWMREDLEFCKREVRVFVAGNLRDCINRGMPMQLLSSAFLAFAFPPPVFMETTLYDVDLGRSGSKCLPQARGARPVPSVTQNLLMQRE